MKFDMHCHTKDGSIDAKVDIESYIKRLIQLGFDGMLVTDHNSYKGYEKWEKIAENFEFSKPFIVLKGIEYDTTDGGHIIAILPNDVHSKLLEIRGMTVAELEKVVHRLGGILGPAHPYGNGFFAFMNTKIGKRNKDFIHKFDFIETFNSSSKPIANIKAKFLAERYNKPSFSGSDAHKEPIIGTAFTIFEKEIRDNNDLIRLIKSNKLKPRAYGKLNLIKSIRKEKHIIIEKLGIIGYWIYNKLGDFVNTKKRNEHIILLKKELKKAKYKKNKKDKNPK